MMSFSRSSAILCLSLLLGSYAGAISLTPEQVKKSPLLKKDLLENPIEQFSRWFEQTKKENVREAETFVLATHSKSGPSSRAMLLKSFDNKGFVFYSSSQGNKAKEMKASSNVSMTFHWAGQWQVNVRGKVELLSAKESAEYFKTRSRESQITSWASHQGKELASRESLHAKVAELQKKHEGHDIPMPPHWQGYRVVPQTIEFWQAGAHNLHDRILYTLKKGKWSTAILSP